MEIMFKYFNYRSRKRYTLRCSSVAKASDCDVVNESDSEGRNGGVDGHLNEDDMVEDNDFKEYIAVENLNHRRVA